MIFFFSENIEAYTKLNNAIKELELEKGNIVTANDHAKENSDLISKEYDELTLKKEALVKRDNSLAKSHKKYLEEYNSILEDKRCLKNEVERLSLECQCLFT